MKEEIKQNVRREFNEKLQMEIRVKKEKVGHVEHQFVVPSFKKYKGPWVTRYL